MRLIDADAFLKSEIERCGCVPLIGSCTSDNEIFKFILERQPTIDAKEVVHGKWILEEKAGIDYWCCSECHKIKSEYYAKPTDNFCGHCGANMKTSAE